MTDTTGPSFEYNEADRLEQSIDVDAPGIDEEDVEAPAPPVDRSAASSLEADLADVEDQHQDVVLEDPGTDEA